MLYSQLDAGALKALLCDLKSDYEKIKASGLKLDLSRGKPGAEQLDISNELLAALPSYKSESGFDCRNYTVPGILDGLPEMKRIFSELFNIPKENIFVGGNASLNLMFDALMRLMVFGAPGAAPWAGQKNIKFICPVPGYDRHFRVLETLKIEMINVEMKDDGPDMDEVERLAASDESIKGLICTPKYSNPTGITFSEKTVRRLASMKTAASDFRIIWDNAYGVHDLYEETEELADILSISREYGNEDRVLYFTSTSKITFPGAGVSIMAASKNNIAQAISLISVQTIGYDKLNQLRHVNYMKNAENVKLIMKKHAAVLRPRFEKVLEILRRDLGGLGIAQWHEPKGGYFISLDVMDGCAKRTYALMSEAGVTLTPAGATYPYGRDPKDRNLRLAPTFPSLPELGKTMDVLTICIRIACIEKLLENK